MKRLPLGARRYNHRVGRAYRKALAVSPDHRDARDRRTDSGLRRLIQHYRNPALIHNGRKPRNA